MKYFYTAISLAALLFVVAEAYGSNNEMVLSCNIEGGMWTLVVDFRNSTVNGWEAQITKESITYKQDSNRISIDRYSGQITIVSPKAGSDGRDFLYRGWCKKKVKRKF